MQRLQAAALGTYDEADRKKAYSGIQKLLARDVPDIELFYSAVYSTDQSGVQELRTQSDERSLERFLWEM